MMKPRDSIPAILSMARSRYGAASFSTTALKPSASLRSVVMSRNRTPGFGKSGTVRISALMSMSRVTVHPARDSARFRHAPRLHEILERFAAHLRVDLEVRHAHHAREFFEHKEIHAIAHESQPVAARHEVAFLLVETGAAECLVGIVQEQLAMLGPREIPEEPVEPQRTNARSQVERIGALDPLDAFELGIHAATLAPRSS